jgi:hypothetical protein
MMARSESLLVLQLGLAPLKRLKVEHGKLEHRGGVAHMMEIGGMKEAGAEFRKTGATGRDGGAGKEAGVHERWLAVAAITKEQRRVVSKVEEVKEGLFFSQVSGSLCSFFREGKSRMVQRQQQIMGEPSEREALLTILLNMPARECLGVISLWDVKELVLPAEGWPY